MARQRKPRDNEEIALRELADAAADLIDARCGTAWCVVGTALTGTFSSITNVSFVSVTIDVDETDVTGLEDWPAADFELEPGATLIGDFTKVTILNTFGVAGLDNLFNVFAAKKC